MEDNSMDITQGTTFIRSNDKTLKLSFLLQVDQINFLR